MKRLVAVLLSVAVGSMFASLARADDDAAKCAETLKLFFKGFAHGRQPSAGLRRRRGRPRRVFAPVMMMTRHRRLNRQRFADTGQDFFAFAHG